MTREELQEALDEILPGSKFVVNKSGEIIIATGMIEGDGGEIVPMDFEEIDDEEFDVEDDLLLLED